MGFTLQRFCSVFATLLFLAGYPATVAAQDTAAPDQRRLLTAEASLNLRSVSELQFSPDGGRLAFVVTEPSKGTERSRHTWIYERQSGAARQFTFSAKSESEPRWSPDGKQLAFLSNRDEDQQQIFLMRADGGEGRAGTKGKRSVKTVGRAADGSRIAFLAPDVKTAEEEKKEKAKDDAPMQDNHAHPAPLWLSDVATHETPTL